MLEKKKYKVCLLEDPQAIISPQDPGEPPSWVPSLPGGKIFWVVVRDVFDALISRRHDKNCDIYPSEIKEQCVESAQWQRMIDRAISRGGSCDGFIGRR